MNERFYGTTGVNAGDCSCEGGQRTGGRTNDCGCELYSGRDAEPSMRYGMPGKPDRVKLLKKIQEYNFMMIEAGIFLNNQPCCEEAQEAFCKYRNLYLETLAEYEECYGPLTYSGINVKRDGWKWVNSPWPWEVEDC